MKTTKRHFAIFRQECLRLQKRWHLDTWKLHFYLGVGNSNHAGEVLASATARQATVCLSASFVGEPTRADLVGWARHEMIHVLLLPFGELAYQRHVRLDELLAAEHEVLQRLEGLLFS